MYGFLFCSGYIYYFSWLNFYVQMQAYIDYIAEFGSYNTSSLLFIMFNISETFGSSNSIDNFLGFSVCEGSVGLGLLVMFVRSYGSDFFSNFSSLWC